MCSWDLFILHNCEENDHHHPKNRKNASHLPSNLGGADLGGRLYK